MLTRTVPPVSVAESVPSSVASGMGCTGLKHPAKIKSVTIRMVPIRVDRFILFTPSIDNDVYGARRSLRVGGERITVVLQDCFLQGRLEIFAILKDTKIARRGRTDNRVGPGE